jgi:ubiquinone/menaquinone biosynthesis C-methylase UbiE
MDRLAHAPEYLDGTLDDPTTLAGNLRDLRRVNRWLGGIDLSAAAIEALAAHRAEVTMLDVGTGGADIPLALLDRARRRGRGLAIVGLDSRPEVLAAAAIATPGLAAAEGLDLHVGDGRSLPFPDRSFDVVHSSLLMHHLEPPEATALLGEMARVARLGVVVNDLDRSRIGLLGAWLGGHVLTRNRYTRNDAPLSVRRAYRPREMADLLRSAGLNPVRIRHAAMRQRYAIAAVHAPPPDGDGTGPPDPIGAGE